MTTFRKTLMATTVLAGLAIFAIDTAQAGPNGPSLGSISGFSSMRMDLNRIGGPGRALSRDDLRVVPVEIKKTEKAPKENRSAPKKKGVDTARVSNPKPAGGGRGKEDVGTSRLHVPAALAEIYRVTGGNLDDISKFGELAGWLKTGPLAAGNPFFTPKGDGSFVWPEELGGGGRKPGDSQNDRNFLDGWSGYSGAPSRFADPSGKVSEGGPTAQDHTRNLSHWWPGHAKDESTQATARGDTRNPYEWMPPKPKDEPTASSPRVFQPYDKVSDPKPDPVAFAKDPNETWYQPSEPKDEDEHEAAHANEQDSQPVAEGVGRPGRTGWCSPTGGCVTGSVVQGPRIIPASDASTPEMRSQLPSWATDPANPDGMGNTSGGGSGYSGYTPEDEGDGAPGSPGGPPT